MKRTIFSSDKVIIVRKWCCFLLFHISSTCCKMTATLFNLSYHIAHSLQKATAEIRVDKVMYSVNSGSCECVPQVSLRAQVLSACRAQAAEVLFSATSQCGHFLCCCNSHCTYQELKCACSCGNTKATWPAEGTAGLSSQLPLSPFALPLWPKAPVAYGPGRASQSA